MGPKRPSRRANGAETPACYPGRKLPEMACGVKVTVYNNCRALPSKTD